MTGQDQPLPTPAQQEAFRRDGVICLRKVLAPDEIDRLRRAVARQMDDLRTSPTGYDFEVLARQVWGNDRPIDTGAADRFDMGRMRALVRVDERARPLLEADSFAPEGMFFYDVTAWKHDRSVREVAFDSALPGIVSTLLDARHLNF